LPLLLDADRGPHGTLVGHVAKTNPHWQIDHGLHSSVAVFHGPHAYISPSWYRRGSPAVPTWNYGVVHAAGKLSLILDREKVAAILQRTVQLFESSFEKPWKDPTPEVNEKLIAAVVAFEMPIDRLEGKFKLGQNRAVEDRIGAIESLEAAGDADGVALAKFAREHLKMPGGGY